MTPQTEFAPPPTGDAIVGRTTELETLAALIANPDIDLIVVEGAAGIGKSSFIQAHLRSQRAAVGRGSRLATPLGVVTRMMGSAVDAPLDENRAELIDRVDAALHATDTHLMVIDDAHWADPDSLFVVGRLLLDFPRVDRTLVLVTRPRSTNPMLSALRDEFAERSSRIVIDHLAEDDAFEIARQTNTALQTADLNRIVQLAGGNPLYLVELANRPKQAGAGGSRLSQILDARLSELSDEAVDAIERAAVIGDEVPTADWLASAALAEGMDALVEAGLMFPSIDQASFSFRHSIVRDHVYENLAPMQRRQLHRTVALALSRPGRQVETARHSLLAGDLVDPNARLELVLRCRSSDRSSPMTRADLFEQAAQQLSEHFAEDPSATAVLAIELHRALDDVDDPRGTAARQHAAELIGKALDPELAIDLAASRLSRTIDGDTTLLDLLLAALEWVDPDDDQLRAQCEAFLSLEMAEWIAGDRPSDMAKRSVQVAHESGDQSALKVALRAQHATAHSRLDAAGRLPITDQLRLISNDSADLDYELLALMHHCTDLVAARRRGQAETLLDQIVDLSTTRRRPRYLSYAYGMRAALADASGQTDDALKLAAIALETGSKGRNPDVDMAMIGQDVVRHWWSKEIAAYAPLALDLWEASPRAPIHGAVLAAALAEAGEAERARSFLYLVFGPTFDQVPHGSLHLAVLAFGAGTIASLGDAEGAATLLPWLTRHRNSDVVLGGAGGILGPVELFIGLLEQTMGDHAAALASFESAAEAARASRYRSIEASVQLRR